jgi:hypothetical protein
VTPQSGLFEIRGYVAAVVILSQASVSRLWRRVAACTTLIVALVACEGDTPPELVVQITNTGHDTLYVFRPAASEALDDVIARSSLGVVVRPDTTLDVGIGTARQGDQPGGCFGDIVLMRSLSGTAWDEERRPETDPQIVIADLEIAGTIEGRCINSDSFAYTFSP